MTPFQAFYLYFSLAVFALAWLKGGHPERRGVALLVTAFILSYLASPLKIDDLRVGEAVIDLVLTLALAWMAFRGDRWWPFAATAFMVLSMLVHLSMLLVPELDQRADLSARFGLGVLVITALLAGVGERWLSGELPISRGGVWRRRIRAS
jgi:peptidoglycan/LPS O-acetylase OafA/YrhL